MSEPTPTNGPDVYPKSVPEEYVWVDGAYINKLRKAGKLNAPVKDGPHSGIEMTATESGGCKMKLTGKRIKVTWCENGSPTQFYIRAERIGKIPE